MMNVSIVFATMLVVAGLSPLPTAATDGEDCYKETITLTVSTQIQADSADELLKKLDVEEKKVPKLAADVGIKNLVLGSRNNNLSFRQTAGYNAAYTASGSSNYTLESEAEATKLFKKISSESIQVNMRLNKNRNRQCTN